MRGPISRRRMSIGLLGAAALSATALTLAACGSGSGYGASSSPSKPGGGAAGASSVPASGAAPKATVQAVQGSGDPQQAWKFVPASVTVPVGATVTFMNTGDQTHTFTADDGSFDTGQVTAGASATIVLTKAGAFGFHCSIHPWMKGMISAGSGATSAGSPAPTVIPTRSGGSNYSSGY